MSILDDLKGGPDFQLTHEIITHQPLFNEDGTQMDAVVLVTRTEVVSEPREDGGRQIIRVNGTESMVLPVPGRIQP